jgi:hypothetical protein
MQPTVNTAAGTLLQIHPNSELLCASVCCCCCCCCCCSCACWSHPDQPQGHVCRRGQVHTGTWADSRHHVVAGQLDLFPLSSSGSGPEPWIKRNALDQIPKSDMSCASQFVVAPLCSPYYPRAPFPTQYPCPSVPQGGTRPLVPTTHRLPLVPPPPPPLCPTRVGCNPLYSPFLYTPPAPPPKHTNTGRDAAPAAHHAPPAAAGLHCQGGGHRPGGICAEGAAQPHRACGARVCAAQGAQLLTHTLCTRHVSTCTAL